MENMDDLLKKIEILYDLLESLGMSREEINLRIRVEMYGDEKASAELEKLLGEE